MLGAGALSAAALAFAGPAFASGTKDVMALQTAASIEVLAIATYKKALTLPFIGGGSANPVVKAFAATPTPSTAPARTANTARSTST